MVQPEALGDMAMDPPDPLPFVSTTALLGDLPPAGVDDLVAAGGPGSAQAALERRRARRGRRHQQLLLRDRRLLGGA
jgi:hypothetical protein